MALESIIADDQLHIGTSVQQMQCGLIAIGKDAHGGTRFFEDQQGLVSHFHGLVVGLDQMGLGAMFDLTRLT